MLGVEGHGLIPFFNSTQSPLYPFHRQPSPPLGVIDLNGVLSTTLESHIRKKSHYSTNGFILGHGRVNRPLVYSRKFIPKSHYQLTHNNKLLGLVCPPKALKGEDRLVFTRSQTAIPTYYF